MAEFCLDYKNFQKQIDKFDTDSKNIKDISYSVEKDGVRLQSIDRYIDCIDEFNSLVVEFGKMLDKDANSMKAIKANWLKLDQDMADITLKELVFGKDN